MIPKLNVNKKNVSALNIFILGAGSDIGKSLAKFYLEKGCYVAGTYRSNQSVDRDLLGNKNASFIKCDIRKAENIKDCIIKYRKSAKQWDIFISCVGSLEPIGKFFEGNFDDWENSLHTNAISQLRFLHGIYPCRHKGADCSIIFFSGGGTNSPFTNYSAYCVSKIMLIKMCELLDDENKDANFFIIGPGWVRTKIHNQTLNNYLFAGTNYAKTKQFIDSGKMGTTYRDIFNCIEWCISKGRRVSGGRNFSVVRDSWENGGRILARQLSKNPDKFKLRRF